MIYYVEDDGSIRDLVLYALSSTGFEACGFPESGPFFRAMEKEKPELILLDIMLPGEDGLKVLEKVRARAAWRKIPVIMLTARGSEYDKVKGLDSGADDYITKPFGVMELVARVKAVLRRAGEEPEEAAPGKNESAEKAQILSCGHIRLDPRRHEVTADGADVVLTRLEFELLKYLIENSGVVVTRDLLLEKVWGYDYEGETRTVDVHVKTLRRKLGDAGAQIETVRGVGYRLCE